MAELKGKIALVTGASSGIVLVYAGSMTATRMPLVRSSWSSDLRLLA